MAKEGKPQKRMGCLIPVLVFVGIVVAIVVAGTSGSGSGGTSKSTLAKGMELTAEQEQAMLTVFEACGILDIEEVSTFQAGEQQTSYHIRDVETDSYKAMKGNIVVWVDNDTKAVTAIYFDDNDIYVDDAVVAQVSDFYVSSALRDGYRVTAQIIVKECLTYPDTAKFGNSSKWAFCVKDGCDVAQSTVTAKNAFGVESTEQFQIMFDRATGNPTSIIIGGTEYIQ